MYDIIIVGGGIVGLATGLRLKAGNPLLKIAILEKESGIAKHQTGHNSGVIHSGLYYKPGSLKAKNCINGYKMLLDFCDKEGVDYELCGKIVVATSQDEIEKMETLYRRGIENGLEGLKKLSAEEIREHEPHCAGIAGIWVPQTGIIDYKKVAAKYAEVFQREGGVIFSNSQVTDVKITLSGVEAVTERAVFQGKLLINCGGLYSDKITRMTSPKYPVKIIPFRGEYYKIKDHKKHLVKNLIYPVPDPNFPFLGVHFTRMAGGEVEAGPNAVLAFSRQGYTKSDINLLELAESLAWPGFQKVAVKYWRTGLGEMYRSYSQTAFTKALQKLIPEIKAEDLEIAEGGVRAQACDKKGGLLDDFAIEELPYVINVVNAPSPAATSSLSVGQSIAEMAFKRF